MWMIKVESMDEDERGGMRQLLSEKYLPSCPVVTPEVEERRK